VQPPVSRQVHHHGGRGGKVALASEVEGDASSQKDE